VPCPLHHWTVVLAAPYKHAQATSPLREKGAAASSESDITGQTFGGLRKIGFMRRVEGDAGRQYNTARPDAPTEAPYAPVVDDHLPIVSTQYITNSNVVSEVVWKEAVVYVTEVGFWTTVQMLRSFTLCFLQGGILPLWR
jgi:hypothetical protein